MQIHNCMTKCWRGTRLAHPPFHKSHPPPLDLPAPPTNLPDLTIRTSAARTRTYQHDHYDHPYYGCLLPPNRRLLRQETRKAPDIRDA